MHLHSTSDNFKGQLVIDFFFINFGYILFYRSFIQFHVFPPRITVSGKLSESGFTGLKDYQDF